MSRHAQMVRIADRRGYRVNAQGQVVTPRGLVRKAYVSAVHPYARLSLKDDEGVSGHFFIHKLAAFQKFGEAALEKGIHVRHMDGNSLNNAPDNLELGTASDNILDRSPECRQRCAQAAADKQKKLTEEQLAEFRSLYAQGWTQKRLRERFGIAKSTASYIANDRTYRPFEGAAQ